jgi:hypothetical protein
MRSLIIRSALAAMFIATPFATAFAASGGHGGSHGSGGSHSSHAGRAGEHDRHAPSTNDDDTSPDDAPQTSNFHLFR